MQEVKYTIIVVLFSIIGVTLCINDDTDELYERNQDIADLYDRLVPSTSGIDAGDLFMNPEYLYWPRQSKDSPYGTLQMQKRRFFAYHPIARFRGIAMESGGSDTGSTRNSYFQGLGRPRSFSPFASSYLMSPSHPVPADTRSKSLMDENKPYTLESKEDLKKTLDDSNSGKQAYESQYFARMGPHRGSKGRNKISRFSAK